MKSFLVAAIATILVVVTPTASYANDEISAYTDLVSQLDANSVTQQICADSPGVKLLPFADVPVQYAWSGRDAPSVSGLEGHSFLEMASTTLVQAAIAGAILFFSLVVLTLFVGTAGKVLIAGLALVVGISTVTVGLTTHGVNSVVVDRYENPTRAVERGTQLSDLFKIDEVRSGLNALDVRGNPGSALVDDTLSRSITAMLNRGHWREAAAIALLPADSSKTQSLRRAAVGSAVKHALSSGYLELAHDYALRANEMFASVDTSFTLDSIRGHLAMRVASAGALDEADGLLSSMEQSFSAPVVSDAYGLLARQRVVDLLTQDQSADRLAKAATLLEAYARRALAHQVRLSVRAHCDILEIAAVYGQSKLNSQDYRAAIQLLEAAKHLNENDAIVLGLLPVAYYEFGVQQMDHRNYKSSSHYLAKSAALRPEVPELQCDTAAAEVAYAHELAAKAFSQEAAAYAASAAKRCESDSQVMNGVAVAYLSAAEAALKAGNVDRARQSFRAAKRLGYSYVNEIVDQHEAAAKIAPSLYRKLQLLSRWADVPKISGYLCARSTTKACEEIALFGSGRMIGTANSDGTQVFFNTGQNGTEFFAMDLNKWNAGFEVFQIDQGSRSQVLYETDGDGRLDRYQLFEGNKLLTDQKLSGRIAVSIASAVIGKQGTDFWDAPDPYVSYFINHSHKGFSNVVSNSYYASFAQTALAYHHRNGDCFEARMYDYDYFTDDEFIDTWSFCGGLPESGHYRGTYGDAVIELRVRPTSLPNGFHVDEHAALENVFRAPSLLNDSNEISDVLRRANAAEVESRTMGQIASFLAPEAILAGFLRRATIAAQIGIGLFTYGVVDHAVAPGDGIN